jgi:hypothetical protein
MTEDEFLAETERLIQDTGTATIHKPDKPKRGGKDVRVQQGTKAR